jgi:DNA-binding YbaB/EbfC family protein
MAKGNFGGGFGGVNMNQLLAQAKKMEKSMELAQEKAKEITCDATSGGGAVKVTANGAYQLVSVEIRKEVLDPDDPEMLQDLILVAVNDALLQVRTQADELRSKASGGAGLPMGF